MRNLSKLSLTLICMLGWTVPVLAQPGEVDIKKEDVEVSSDESKPVFSPRVGVNYTTEGPGFEGFTKVGGFIPLFQNAGFNLTFLEGNILIDNDSKLGGNIILGQRFYSQKDDRVFGVYISYDQRETSTSDFQQIGAGFESLGKNWDFRANFYMPVQNTEKTLSEILTGNVFFQANMLMADRRRVIESAIPGFDTELGAKLAGWNSGDLRGYAGLYYYGSGANRGDILGWKLRLAAQPNNYSTFGVSVQNDSLFDTRVVFNVGLNFPSSGDVKGKNTNPVISRLGSSPDRNSAITVNKATVNDSIALINPATNQPYNFIHVNTGGNSTGAFEDPFGKIEDAIKVAKANDLIYVRFGNTVTLAPLTVPSNVQVLSNSVNQTVSTTQLGTIKLPFSGTGSRPKVTGNVAAGEGIITLGNNSVVSGLNIEIPGNAEVRGIKGVNVSNVTIKDNTITNAFGEGIYLENVSGTAIIDNNTITNTRNPSTDTSLESGIFIWNYKGSANLTITNNTINTLSGFTATGYRVDGIEVNLCRDYDRLYLPKPCTSPAEITANISNNIVDHKNSNVVGGADGIDLNVGNLGKATFIIDNNTINKIPDEGISINSVANSESKFTITNNKINESLSDSGIEVDLFKPINNPASNLFALNEFNNSKTEFIIRNNTIDKMANDGIDFTVEDNANTTLTITNNTITNTGNGETGDRGIQLETINNAVINATIKDNTITKTSGDGIYLRANDNSKITANVINNKVTDANTNGLTVDGRNTSTNTSTFTNNIVTGGNNGFFVRNANTAKVTSTFNNNQIKNSNVDGIVTDFRDSSNTTLNITNNTIEGVKANAINPNANVNSTSSAVVNLTISGNTLKDNFRGVDPDALGGSKWNFVFDNNTITNTQKIGFGLYADNTSNVVLKANNNTFTNNNTDNTAISAFDVALDPNIQGNSPQICLRLSNNKGSNNKPADFSIFNGNVGVANFRVENTLSTNTGTISIESNLTSATTVNLNTNPTLPSPDFTTVTANSCQ